MADQQKDQKPRREIVPESYLRLFAYIGFVTCSLLLMVALSVPGWNWRAALVGTLIYGAFTVVMYRGEQARRESRALQRAQQQARAESFDFSDDDESDPTQPPTRIR
jgi:membrane protein implicated in regulation of membrane protease activity